MLSHVVLRSGYWISDVDLVSFQSQLEQEIIKANWALEVPVLVRVGDAFDHERKTKCLSHGECGCCSHGLNVYARSQVSSMLSDC